MGVFIIFWCSILAMLLLTIAVFFISIGSGIIGIGNAIVKTAGLAIVIGLISYASYLIGDMVRHGVFHGAGKVADDIVGLVLIFFIALLVIGLVGNYVIVILGVTEIFFEWVANVSLKLGGLLDKTYAYFVERIVANIERC